MRLGSDGVLGYVHQLVAKKKCPLRRPGHERCRGSDRSMRPLNSAIMYVYGQKNENDSSLIQRLDFLAQRVNYRLNQ